MSTLAHWQGAFAQALMGAPEPPPRSPDIAAQTGFAIYRNTVTKGCIDAMQANYPAIARLVGEEWFRAAAAVFVAQSPPRDARLLVYGAGFADFLERFEPAGELPYLADVARLDRCWTEAHVAADAEPVAAAALAALAPEQLAARHLALHPATRWHVSHDWPAYTLWQRNRAAGEIGELVWQGEAALITRPHDAVLHLPLSLAGAALLHACGDGRALGEAAAAALEVDPHTDLQALIARLLQAGAFCS